MRHLWGGEVSGLKTVGKSLPWCSVGANQHATRLPNRLDLRGGFRYKANRDVILKEVNLPMILIATTTHPGSELLDKLNQIKIYSPCLSLIRWPCSRRIRADTAAMCCTVERGYVHRV